MTADELRDVIEYRPWRLYELAEDGELEAWPSVLQVVLGTEPERVSTWAVYGELVKAFEADGELF